MTTPVALLDAIVRDALDPSYAEAAARHRAWDRQRVRSWRRTSVAGAALLLGAGALAGVAISSEQQVIPQVGAARNALAGSAGVRTRQVTALEEALASRQREVTARQTQQLEATSTGRALQEQSARLSAATAEVAVHGPGVRLRIADAGVSAEPDAGDRPTGSTAGPSGTVTDRDLQDVVNALWAGGAEAISVGGVRLGPQTAIRTAGQTILAGFQPLRSPYVIEAIGPPTLVRVQQAPALVALSQPDRSPHPTAAIQSAPALNLPAAAPAQLSSGQPIPGGRPSPSAGPS